MGVGRAAVDPAPERQRLPQRPVLVERGPLVEQRHGAGPLELAFEGPGKARENPQQARFADPVGPGHLQRLARPQRERKPREQQPVALAAGEVVGRELSLLHGPAA